MTGIINKTARQLDLRGRDASGIVHVTLNPGFNVVDDITWDVLLKNAHVSVLVDEGAIIVGVRKTKADVDAERELAERELANTLPTPTAAAGVVKTGTENKDPNLDPQTGAPLTETAPAADSKLEL